MSGRARSSTAAPAQAVFPRHWFGLLDLALLAVATATYLLLDEPAAGLPSSDSEVLFDFLQMLPKDVSILVVEHDMNLVFRFAFLRVARRDEA